VKYNSAIHKRQSIRLKGYDYSQSGFYFITICCYQRECLFGDIINSQMILNDFGELVKEEWLKSTVQNNDPIFFAKKLEMLQKTSEQKLQ
jgi:hypothetical protein